MDLIYILHFLFIYMSYYIFNHELHFHDKECCHVSSEWGKSQNHNLRLGSAIDLVLSEGAEGLIRGRKHGARSIMT